MERDSQCLVCGALVCGWHKLVQMINLGVNYNIGCQFMVEFSEAATVSLVPCSEIAVGWVKINVSEEK